MYLRLIGLLLLVPLADVLLLVVLATGLGPVTIGPAATVAVVVLTALLGLLLVRAEGRHTVGKIQRKLASGKPPTDELLDGAFLLVAGALMVTPGLVTDLIGLVFALPPTRYPFKIGLKRYVLKPYVEKKTGGFATGNVYIGGFPGGDGDGDGFRGFPGAGGGAGAGGDPGTGSGPGAGSGSGTTSGGAGADGTIEMGADDYEFEDLSESEATGADGTDSGSDSDEGDGSRDRQP